MVVTCPSCSSGYDLDPARIGRDGRKVRCAACRDSWFVAAQPEDERLGAAAALVADPSPTRRPDVVTSTETDGRLVERREPIPARRPRPPQTKKRQARRPRRSDAKRKPSGGMTAILALLLVALLPGIVLRRDAVVAALPGTASLFQALGLPVNLVGLSFEGVSSSLVADATGTVLEIQGEVRNLTGYPLDAPSLDIAIAGENGDLLYTWSARPIETPVAPESTAAFRTRLAAPPPAGRRVEVTFRTRPGPQVALR